jgi:hypothetical protein
MMGSLRSARRPRVIVLSGGGQAGAGRPAAAVPVAGLGGQRPSPLAGARWRKLRRAGRESLSPGTPPGAGSPRRVPMGCWRQVALWVTVGQVAARPSSGPRRRGPTGRFRCAEQLCRTSPPFCSIAGSEIGVQSAGGHRGEQSYRAAPVSADTVPNAPVGPIGRDCGISLLSDFLLRQ